MTLEDTYFISQIIAAVAIVASLVFVGLQLRQSDKTQRAAMHQARADRIINVFQQLAQPHMAAAFAKATSAPETLTAQDVTQLRSFVMALVLNIEDHLWQHRAGLLDAETVERSRHTGRIIMMDPAMRALWHITRPGLYPQQVETFERELIRNQPISASPDLQQSWLAALSEVKGAARPHA
jgi:hypothetical protein